MFGALFVYRTGQLVPYFVYTVVYLFQFRNSFHTKGLETEKVKQKKTQTVSHPHKDASFEVVLEINCGELTYPMKDGETDTNEAVNHSLHGAIAGTEGTAREAVLGLAGGVLFGLVSPLIGHPFDTLKTRMQAEKAYRYTGIFETAKRVYLKDGLIGGFYRGLVPPLIGSIGFRSIQFSAYAGAFSACEDVKILSEPIPYTCGMRPSVLVAATSAAFARSVIESPLDFIKVRVMVGKNVMQEDGTKSSGRQNNAAQIIRSMASSPVSSVQLLYRGFSATFYRTLGLLGSFFIMVDYSVRYIPEVINAPVTGPFFKGGICATTAWVFAFPFESVKSVIQADTTGRYKSMTNPTLTVLKDIYRERGVIQGLYRGFGPGASRSFVANGISMSVYTWFQNAMRQ